MAKAYIIKSGTIVKDDNWSKVVFSITTGFLYSFTTDRGINYIHVNKTTLNNQLLSSGYYPEEDFLLYLKNKENKIFDKRYSDFLLAEEGDIIIVRRIEAVLDAGNSTAFIQEYSFNYEVNTNYLIGLRTIRIPNTDVIKTPKTVVNHNSTGANFLLNYNFNVVLSQILNDDEKIRALILLGQIALVINLIESKIFKLFPETNDNYINLINSQKEFWTSNTSQIFTERSTLNDFEMFLGTIFSFYKAAYRNTNIIKSARGNEKLFWLTITLSSKTLAVLTVPNRTSLLEDLVNDQFENKLSRFFEKIEIENFVIRVVNSFTFSRDFTKIDAFLDWILSLTFTNGVQSKTYYELLFDRMSSDLNITVSTISLANWLFEGNWKPDDTKGIFTKTIYKLWVVSKYNPYNLDGILKPNSIGKIAKFRNPDGTESSDYGYESDFNEIDPVDQQIQIYREKPQPENLYYYTNYTAYRPEKLKDETTERIGLIIGVERNLREEAAPPIIHYQSKNNFGVFNDNLDFEIKQNQVSIIEETEITYRTSINPDINETSTSTRKFLFGTYHLFQPVTLLDINKENLETKIPIPLTSGGTLEPEGKNINSVVPVFMLHYIQNANQRSNTETIIGYTIDGVLTLSGIGNITKFRHLAKLSRLEQVKRIIGGVEFVSGVLSYLTSFIEECDANDEFCKNIKAFTFWLEMASLSSDAITELLLKRAARKAKNLGYPSNFDDALTKQKINELASVVDKLLEVENFLKTVDNKFLNFKNKLTQIKEDNINVAFEIVDSLKKNDNVYKVLDDNPDFINSLGGIEETKSLIKTINLLGETKPKLLSRIENFEPIRFNNIHSDLELKDIIERAIELNLPIKELDDFIYISCRTGPPPPDKRILSSELKDQMTYWQTIIKERGYPSRFNNIDDFIIFSNRLKELMKSYNLPTDNVFIQGSALRKINADDVDVAVILTQEQLSSFIRYSEDVWRVRRLKGLGRLKKVNNKVKKYQKGVRQAINNGIVKPDWWKNNVGQTINDKASLPDTFQDVSHLFEGVSDYAPNKLNLSIIISDGKFDVSPYLKL